MIRDPISAMELFDTHSHINDRRLRDNLPEVIQRATDNGVTRIVTIGTSLETSRQCVDIAHQFPRVFAAVGIQPNCTHEARSGDWDAVVSLLDQDGVVALGETGLDRYWKDAPFELQQDYFDRHLRLSQARDIPFIVHMRDCGPEVLDMLTEARQRGPLRGVMHSFTGDLELMRACVELGMLISFAGMVTFKKSDALREVAVAVPGDRLLIETDAPYLTPEPKRKQRPNEPALVLHTAECLAKARGESLASLCERTTQNAMTFFGL